ncbi:MAG: DUF1566 domain-containing protein [Alphaproteobacteria bacterium]|nr:DUF1566 domain-containing protein [Alphaproteobacteria bacterium]
MIVAIDCTDTALLATAPIGARCTDGSIHAGAFEGTYLMITAIDAPTALSWGSSGILRGASSMTEGAANTATLAAFGAAAHPAARYCADLSANGQTDWHLPARDELAQLYTNRAALGSLTNWWYWSSSEGTSAGAWGHYFPTGAQLSDGNKGVGMNVRCVRRVS